MAISGRVGPPLAECGPIGAGRTRHPAISVLLALAAILIGPSSAAADGPWQGDWRSYWRDGQALMTLEQQGDTVTGRYRPGNGRIEAKVQGSRLRGRWIEPEREGGFVFALGEDGTSFVGRFDNGEYWNGEALTGNTFMPTPFRSAETPRATLRTVVVAMNASRDGETAATLIWEPLLSYAGEATDQRERGRRSDILADLIARSTFRIANAPEQGVDGEARFEIGAAGVDWHMTLRFIEAGNGAWRIEVPPLEILQRWRERALAAAGHADMASWRKARQDSPRGAMKAFLKGASAWESGGEAMVMGTLDLSQIPSQLRGVEGVVAADYLRQILNRVGYVIWQEIPDNPASASEYLHFEHAAGDVTIAPVDPGEEGGRQWRFSSDTIAALPRIYNAIGDLPSAPGVSPAEPFSDYFRLRRWVGNLSPALLRRDVVLETWQWAALGLALATSLVLAVLAGALSTWLMRSLVGGTDAPGETRRSANRVFVWPVRIFVLGVGLLVAVRQFGLRADVAAFLGGGAALALVAAATIFFYALTGVIGARMQARAAKGVGGVDEIVVSLAVGIIKILVLVGGVVAAAEVLALPYEGVIAGLGIGGLALAIAGRDTVSNFIGAAILLADRPFKRGDLIEAAGNMATVESVGLRSTRLRSFDDTELIVPNSRLSEDIVNNWGRRRARRILLSIGLERATPRERLDAFTLRLRDVYLRQPRADSTVYLGLKAIGESSIDIELWGHFRVADYEEYVEAQHRLIGDILDLAAEMDVGLAYPTRTLRLPPGSGEPPAPLIGA